MVDFTQHSAVSLARAIRERKISSVEATKEALARLEASHAKTNCVVAFEADEALAGAKAADAAIAAGRKVGPLAGVPLAHKDMFDRKGKIASWGARIRADKPSQSDATVIERFAAAGALQVAALHLTEFAFGPTGHNYVIGHARNPWDTSRITGGSSAGTACAVAMGAIPAGLGSDTAGSLRLPAAACGVTSIKPTFGRISRAGAMPLALCLDTLGVIARHVEDLAVMTGLLSGADPRDAHAVDLPVPDYAAALSKPVKGLRLGIDESLISEAHADVQQMVQRVVEVLTKTGLEKAGCTFPHWQTVHDLTSVMQLPDAASAHFPYMVSRAQDYGPQVRARLEVGFFVSGIDHMTGLRARGAMLRKVLDETFSKIDVAILPIFADPLPTIAELDVAGGPALQATMARVIKYTRPVNYFGLPTLTLPVPRAGGLPNGVQIIAKPFYESMLFAIGAAYQREVPPQVAPA